MKKHKRIALLIGAAILLGAALWPFVSLSGATNAAAQYLEQKTLSPWSIMALAAAGKTPSLDSLSAVPDTKAVDLEAPILALATAGKDPRTFGSADLVAKLKGFFDGTQLGEASILNDDIFGLLALIASGESASEGTAASLSAFIKSKQHSDGGFGFAIGGTSDTNTTAAAIMALRAANVGTSDAVIVKALDYLRAAQNSDGGFPYDPKSEWGTGSDASSDAWVIMAVKAVGSDAASWQKGDKNPLEHLESLQAQDGSFLYQAGGAEDSFTPVTTSYALIALSGKTLPVKTLTSTEASFSIQVEKSSGLICDADGKAATALDALKAAAQICSFELGVKSSSFGDYVDEIAGEKASGSSGWLYTVNGTIASVGAGAYKLADGDAVRWYFGNYDGTSANEALRTEIPLLVIIPPAPSSGEQSRGDSETEEEDSVISMVVTIGGKTQALSLGTASRGGIITKKITIQNSGGVATALSTSVSGDAVFRKYLRLNEKSWRDYSVMLAANQSTTTKLLLPLPADYAGSGTKKGTLVFWATPAAQ